MMISERAGVEALRHERLVPGVEAAPAVGHMGRRRAQARHAEVERGHGDDHQPVADAAHGLHDQRIGRIELDLAPQAVDLDIHGALVDRPPVPASAMRGTVSPGAAASTRSISRSRSVSRTDLVAAAQLGPPEMKHELPEADALGRSAPRQASRRRRMLATRSDSSRGSNGLET